MSQRRRGRPACLLSKHHIAQVLAALVLSIAVTNLFNRVNASTKQVAGA